MKLVTVVFGDSDNTGFPNKENCLHFRLERNELHMSGDYHVMKTVSILPKKIGKGSRLQEL